MINKIKEMWVGMNWWERENFAFYFILECLSLIIVIQILFFGGEHELYEIPKLEYYAKLLFFVFYFLFIINLYLYLLYKIYILGVLEAFNAIFIPITKFEKFWISLYLLAFQFFTFMTFISLNPKISQSGFYLSEAGVINSFLFLPAFFIYSLSFILNLVSVYANFVSGYYWKALLILLVPIFIILPLFFSSLFENILIQALWNIYNLIQT